MKLMKLLVTIAAVTVFLICFYTFLQGNEVFAGKFKNEVIPWYFLAKGIFCSVSLYLLALILEQIAAKK